MFWYNQNCWLPSCFAFMYEPFQIPVTYKGKDFSFPSNLLKFGYIHKIKVDVFSNDILLERDEDGNFRAVMDPERLESNKIEVDLLKAISEAIEEILK